MDEGYIMAGESDYSFSWCGGPQFRINMALANIGVLILLHFGLADCIIYEKPDYVNTCTLQDPGFVNCSTAAVQVLFDTIPGGIPEIGLDVLDPLKVPVIKILQGSGPVNVNASLTNVTVIGFGKTKVTLNRVDSKYKFYTDIKLPRLRIEGKYVLLGKILVIPLKGSGHCWFDSKNLDIFVRMENKIVEREGLLFFSVQKVHIKFNIGGLRLYLGNLFDGIKPLEETTNAYLNDNWKILADSLNPILSRTIEGIMTEILTKIFDNIPAKYFISDVKL